MKPIRTRDDIFAAINCRMAEIEGHPRQSKELVDLNKMEQVIDFAITAAARIIRVIEGAIKYKRAAGFLACPLCGDPVAPGSDFCMKHTDSPGHPS